MKAKKEARQNNEGISRRTFIKAAGALGAAAAVGPQILIPSARGAKKDQVVFVSEESNPKAIAVYEKINGEFEKNTGIKVVMEYPGFANIHKRVATLIAAGTPPEIVWYGAGQAMNLALENQLVDVGDVIKETGGVPDNLRMVYKGADRSIPTSQQFTYDWYRKDLYQQKNLQPMKTWEDYLNIAKTLNNPPNLYGCIIPSAETGAGHGSSGNGFHEQQRPLVRVQQRQKGLRGGPGQGREQEAGR